MLFDLCYTVRNLRSIYKARNHQEVSLFKNVLYICAIIKFIQFSIKKCIQEYLIAVKIHLRKIIKIINNIILK